MKIQYKKKVLKSNLFFAGMWLIFGILSLLTKDKTSWTDYGYLVLAVLYFVHYVYININSYVKIENGKISTSSLFSKKINLNSIQRIKKFAGEYTLIDGKTELKINTELIEEKSLEELDTVLENLNLEIK